MYTETEKSVPNSLSTSLLTSKTDALPLCSRLHKRFPMVPQGFRAVSDVVYDHILKVKRGEEERSLVLKRLKTVNHFMVNVAPGGHIRGSVFPGVTKKIEGGCEDEGEGRRETGARVGGEVPGEGEEDSAAGGEPFFSREGGCASAGPDRGAPGPAKNGGQTDGASAGASGCFPGTTPWHPSGHSGESPLGGSHECSRGTHSGGQHGSLVASERFCWLS
ncbi:uncharacterized protein LOC128222621 [Mya arenaria]|uniref:uncharacterized protein LOC128222621 n=1 Tax=Mya arenaria TaxID=6604 RepID=UPI0022E724CC|nr:uncharacterized protein LOC128222621 [Mya arenaria]